MFEFRLIDNKNKVNAIAFRCINYKKETFLYLTTFTSEEMISKFVLNAILQHVSMPWIICYNEGNETKKLTKLIMKID